MFVVAILPFGIGRCLTGAFETWFLAFLDPWITGEETTFAHGGISVPGPTGDRTGQTKLYCIGLTGDTTTFYMDGDIIGALDRDRRLLAARRWHLGRQYG